jgi:hypothetical protein
VAKTLDFLQSITEDLVIEINRSQNYLGGQDVKKPKKPTKYKRFRGCNLLQLSSEIFSNGR